MRRPIFLLSAFALVATLASGCAFAYASNYHESNHDLHPKPVTAAKVKVVKSRDDLTRQWTELGAYKGHAPTVKEAMEAAKQTCGSYGADFFILNTAPFLSENVYKVDGICAVTATAVAKK